MEFELKKENYILHTGRIDIVKYIETFTPNERIGEILTTFNRIGLEEDLADLEKVINNKLKQFQWWGSELHFIVTEDKITKLYFDILLNQFDMKEYIEIPTSEIYPIVKAYVAFLQEDVN
ncbi:hypothetical protein [Emticicia sp. C21]|uniref:hypothetical protein n=1 Tax=Emticicia sp. C21 TaxID=2302915 RepID=UPI000E3424F8|nr:hypothetical protein [Emticicia sp. C21]RFS18390.1 hypothetical protein D0T08_03840 [Emticicia sp. C21]